MSRETIRKNLPFITAYAEGKTVDFRYADRKEYSDNWDSLDEDKSITIFIDEKWEFRIKPEPREFWLYRNNSNHEWIVGCSEPHGWGERIHLREVIEE